MISRIHEKLGTVGFVLSIVALIAALSGAAYAATKLNPKQKKEVVKIAKKYAGKRGPAGPAGTNGTNGTNGTPGSAGKDGAAGAEGKQGPQGDPGPQGNPGPQGTQGVEGDPWTVGGVLPPGETETGSWSFGRTTAAGKIQVPLSFFLPLPENLKLPEAPGEESHVHYVKANGNEVLLNLETGESGEVASTVCLGTSKEPKASPGHLCIYEKQIVNTTGLSSSPAAITNFDIWTAGGPGGGASPTGAYMELNATGAEARGTGTFAVTAPEAP